MFVGPCVLCLGCARIPRLAPQIKLHSSNVSLSQAVIDFYEKGHKRSFTLV